MIIVFSYFHSYLILFLYILLNFFSSSYLLMKYGCRPCGQRMIVQFSIHRSDDPPPQRQCFALDCTLQTCCYPVMIISAVLAPASSDRSSIISIKVLSSPRKQLSALPAPLLPPPKAQFQNRCPEIFMYFFKRPPPCFRCQMIAIHIWSKFSCLHVCMSSHTAPSHAACWSIM